MWYHGRSSQDGDGAGEGGQGGGEGAPLPPLSTGRIGRATSRNGLAWKREKGSVSEDGSDEVVLGKNQEDWWSFDTAHVGLGQVMLPLTTPAVMTEGGVYLMYYMGGSWDEMEMRIGVALSQDGTTFGRVEGDHSTGACMVPYDASTEPVFDDGGYGPAVIEEELYCGWPDVVVNSVKDRKKNDKRGFFMYYSTMLKETKEKAIGLAMSQDGFRWYKRGICLRSSSSGEEADESSSLDSGGCARSTIVRNASFDEKLQKWDLAEGWIMFYEGVDGKDGKHRILTATSDDGVNWVKGGMALDVGEDGAWDSKAVGSAHVIRLDDGSVRMYYTGQGDGKDGKTAIGVAKCENGDIGGENCVFVRENISWAAW